MNSFGYGALTLDDLHALVDGALDPMANATVAAAACANREASALVTDCRDQNAGLKELYGSVADEPIPAAMRMLINSYACELRQAS